MLADNTSAPPPVPSNLLLILIAMLCLMSVACGEKSIAKVPTESDAIEIINVLTENNFEVEKVEVGEGETTQWSVVLDEGWFGGGEVSKAMQVLHYYGLPRREDHGAAGEETGVFPSPQVESAKRLKQREREMERKLRMLPSVVRANVTLVLPEDDSLKLEPYPATASVWIMHKDPKPAFSGEHVQNQVAGGVPGLKPERVTVMMSHEPPPIITRQDVSARRRNNLLLAGGAGLAVLLCFFLLVLLLQTRRQRAEIAALREISEPPTDVEEEMAPSPAKSVGGSQRSLTDGRAHTAEEASKPRQLPAGATSSGLASQAGAEALAEESSPAQ